MTGPGERGDRPGKKKNLWRGKEEICSRNRSSGGKPQGNRNGKGRKKNLPTCPQELPFQKYTGKGDPGRREGGAHD